MLYRIVEIIGRWSMLDMFVVSVMVALVQLGIVANVAPRIGATFCAAVVVLTILAEQMGFTIEACIEMAWDEIKDRKGRMIDGVFVKEADL